MRPAVTQAALAASKAARAAKTAEKAGKRPKKGELTAAVSKLKKAKAQAKAQVGAEAGADATHPQDAGAGAGADSEADATKSKKTPPTYRNSPTYKAHHDYPLARSLLDRFQADLRFGAGGVQKSPDHVDIVSPALCSDIINHIGSSLDKYKGCDIIDIHPGACLWSQKIHDHLQPRRHLLLEPDDRYFEPFVQPLLHQKNSTYRHSTLSGAHPKNYWDTYDQIFNDVLLPKRDPLPPGHAQLREPNTSLLVIGNLVRRYNDWRQWLHQVHTANLLINQMAQASQTNDLFHRYGLVRMLFWIPEDTIAGVLPDNIVSRQGYSVGLDSVVDLVEIAGRDRSVHTRTDARKKIQHKQRQDQLDTWGAQRVAQRMQDGGISMPVHRRPIAHQRALDTDETLQDYNPVRLPEGTSLQDMVSNHEKSIERIVDYAKRLSSKPKPKPIPYTFKWTNVSEDYIGRVDKIRVGPWMETWGAQIALEHEFGASRNKLSQSDQSDLEARLLAASKQISALFEKLASQVSSKSLVILVNEIFALCRKEPLLAWDRRPFEPLKVKDEEFWPQYPLHLIDMQPRKESLGDDLMTATDANRLRRGLIKTLFTHQAAPLIESIERIAPGASDIDVPEFKDPLKGGRLNLKELLTRDANREQIDAFAKAYIEWPFRPLGIDEINALEGEEGEVL